MASLLRQIVAAPRARHEEAGLDLCYITDNIIATSGPSANWPQIAYRNPVDALVRFLDYKHGHRWAIWEFRAEGTGYPDEAVNGRVSHYPWPDHHPPPFVLVPAIIGGMRNWLKDGVLHGSREIAADEVGKANERVIVVHCKAGKGRSGTMACSYLMVEENWTREDAQKRFTERRMRPGFGQGVSIPSQLRWLTYVERWRDNGHVYVEQQVEVTEVRVWGLRDGVKIAVEGFIDDGRTIKAFHTFSKAERVEEENSAPEPSSDKTSAAEKKEPKWPASPWLPFTGSESSINKPPAASPTINAVFRPSQPIILPTNEINLACERRHSAAYGWTLVTSVAHVWFNCFFESGGPEACKPTTSTSTSPSDSSDDPAAKLAKQGTFSIDWDAMDGIKGSSRKGQRSFDRVSISWRTVTSAPKITVMPPKEGEAVREMQAADWRGSQDDEAADEEEEDAEGSGEGLAGGLGLRKQALDSAAVSRAPSEPDLGKLTVDAGEDGGDDLGNESDVEMTKTHGLEEGEPRNAE